MKALTTIKVCGFGLIIIIMMLSSCAFSGKFSRQNPDYHLDLVKANKPFKQPQKSYNDSTLMAVKPIAQKRLIVDYKPDNLLILTVVQENNVSFSKTHTNSCLSYKNSRLDNIKTNAIALNYHRALKRLRLPVKERSDLLDRPINLFIICLICSAAAVACFLFASQISFLTFFGYLAGIAAIIFFGIWLLSLADNYYD